MTTDLAFSDGVYTVLATPFAEEQVAWDSLGKFIEGQLTTGIAGFVLLGTTSEAPTLSQKEKEYMVTYVSALVKGRKPLIVGVGGNDTRATLAFAKFCVPYATGLMVTVPHYNKPQQRGIVQHFVSIASADELKGTPILMYNIPGRTCVNMEPESVLTVLASCPNVVAIKEASGSMDQLRSLVKGVTSDSARDLGKTFKIFAGDDSSIMEVSKVGGSGVISVGSNVIPEYIVELEKLCREGAYDRAEKAMEDLIRFTRSLFIETNPVPIKYLLFKINLYKSAAVRLPLMPLEHKYPKDLVYGEFLRITSGKAV